MPDRSIYTESERFKQGSVAGFYDARSDDGLRYLDDILRFGIQSDDQHQFMVGYRYGQQMRLGLFIPKVHSRASVLCEAA